MTHLSRHTVSTALSLCILVTNLVANADLYAQDLTPALKVDGTKQSVTERIFEEVRAKSKTISEKDYLANTTALPDILKQLSYDQYRAIRYKPERSVWRNNALFEVQPFHTGFIFRQPVKINTVNNIGETTPVLYSSDDFSYDQPVHELAAETLENLAFSGFRVNFPLNTDRYKDELITFQGASYFRLLSAAQSFGLSARGLALNTAEPEGEEFPYFSEFWLIKPNANVSQLNIVALLESPSVTGAYLFTLEPGAPTELTIEAYLYARENIKKLGLAPLTSMFLQGENSVSKLDDYRPEVHDSDGLLIENENGEWTWRALSNPRDLSIVSLKSDKPRGFGLMQRDMNFDHYQDIESNYQNRPSLWVTPLEGWDAGHIELVEIPTSAETNDNIVAYWVPEKPFEKGDEYHLRYSLKSVTGDFGSSHLAKVTRTANSWSLLPGSDSSRKRTLRRLLVDFSSPAINSLKEDIPIKANISTQAGRVFDVNVQKLPDGRGWRASFQIDHEGADIIDARLYLTLRDKTMSEVWNYVWSSKSLN